MKKVKIFLAATALIIGFSNYAAQANITFKFNQIPDGGSSKYGNDSSKCVTNLSLYSDYYKQWSDSKYKNNDLANSAYKYWRYCFLECPMSSQNLYNRGVIMVSNIIKNLKDSTLMDAYVDTLMMVYERRIEYFPNNKKYPVGYIIGRQAVDLYKYHKDSSNQFYPLFKKSFELMQDKSEPTVLYGYFISTVKYWKDAHCDIDLVFETYMKVYDILQYNTNNLVPEEAKKYKSVSDNIESIMVQIATCDKLVKVFEPKFDANPSDTILARNLVRIFELRKCTNVALYYKALVQVHKIAPTAATAYSLGKMSMEKGIYENAKNYLQSATELFPDSMSERKADSYLLLADVYKTLNQFTNSRNAALKVLKYRPNEAYAYIIIGDLYVKSAGDCKFKDLAVSYWAAADKFAQAASIAKDPKVKNAALNNLARIKRSFPTQQEIFMRNLALGSTYQVECWINETTTVRIRN
ncbi:MAG: hypothetical protein AUJ98_05675 [Bacteroidetes bacterium CG2_30_33_31]|nr:MAG: hypothetical protein AUJ98_05675 [Bacteroidetes bacterium CG2_30_33_31]